MLKNNASFQLNRSKKDPAVDVGNNKPAEKKAFTFNTIGIRKQTKEKPKEEKKVESSDSSQEEEQKPR